MNIKIMGKLCYGVAHLNLFENYDKKNLHILNIFNKKNKIFDKLINKP